MKVQSPLSAILAITALFQISKKILCPLQTTQEIDKLEIDDTNCDEKIQRMDGTIKVSNSDVRSNVPQ